MKPVQDLFLDKMKNEYRSFLPESASSTLVNDSALSKKETCSTFKTEQDYQDEFPQRDIPLPKVSMLAK